MDDDDDTDTDNNSSEIEGLKNRIREMGRQKSALAAELRQVKEELETSQAKASTADTLATQLEKANADLQSARQSAEWTDAMLVAGVTDASGREFLSYQYGRLGDDRPDFAKWLGDRKENAKGFEATLFGGNQQQGEQQEQQTRGQQGEQQEQQTRGQLGEQQRRGVTTGGAHNSAKQGLTWEQILDPNTPADQALGGGGGAMPWTQLYQK